MEIIHWNVCAYCNEEFVSFFRAKKFCHPGDRAMYYFGGKYRYELRD